METPRASPAFTRLDPEGRRRQIIEAATHVFSERSYGSVSMNDIAETAKVTRGLIHHYFGSKPQLFGAVVQSLASRVPSANGAAPDSDLEQTVASTVDAWLDFLAEHKELALTIGAGLHPEDPELNTIIQTARNEIVDRVIASLPDAPPRAMRLLVRAYLGLADAAAREWLYLGRASRQEVHTVLTRSLIAMIAEALPALSVTPTSAQPDSS